MNPVLAVESTISTPYLNMEEKEHQTARYIIAQHAIVFCGMYLQRPIFKCTA